MNDDNKTLGQAREEAKKDPMAMMFSLMVGSSLETQSAINELVNKYEANGVDVIPVSEIKNALGSSIEKQFKDEKSFMNKLMA